MEAFKRKTKSEQEKAARMVEYLTVMAIMILALLNEYPKPSSVASPVFVIL